MTAWTDERERRAIVAHVARCAFCRSLVEASRRRRRDLELLEAAERLAAEHAENEVEYTALRRPRVGALESERRNAAR